MTVAELIAALQRFDPSMPVIVRSILATSATGRHDTNPLTPSSGSLMPSAYSRAAQP